MLPKLPEELLSHIFGFLAIPSTTELADAADGRIGPNINRKTFQENMRSNQQTLFNVCQASKAFYRLAWPTLYGAYSSWSVDEGSLSPSYFLRTLCLRPEYGETLRSFSIRDRDTIDEITIERLYGYFLRGDAMTMAVFQWRARSFWLEGYEGGQTFQDRLVRSLLIGMDDGIMCMVLLMCPKITELSISLPWDCGTSYLIAELFAVITSPQTVPSPRDMPAREPISSRYATSQILGTSWPNTRWQQPGVLEFLSEFTLRSDVNTAWEPLVIYVSLLPSLKTLRIYSMISGPSQDERVAFETNTIGRRRTHQLRALHLPECQLGDTCLRELVQLFPHLETLNIDWSIMHRGFISMKQIGRAIARYIPQLVHLTLDASLCRAAEDSFDDDLRMSDTLCDSIKTMQYLERLRINDQAIWSPLHIQNGVDLTVEPGITHILPVRVTWLEVLSPLNALVLGWKDPNLYAQYQSWQDRDLCALLLDESFTELEHLDIHNCKRELNTISVRERGWVHEAVVTERGAKVERMTRPKIYGELNIESRTQKGI
ncbi:hypothetical protein MBLNU13_g00119t1 [Cladosporium sp. NU13]